jgi:hypothetical protein
MLLEDLSFLLLLLLLLLLEDLSLLPEEVLFDPPSLEPEEVLFDPPSIELLEGPAAAGAVAIKRDWGTVQNTGVRGTLESAFKGCEDVGVSIVSTAGRKSGTVAV